MKSYSKFYKTKGKMLQPTQVSLNLRGKYLKRYKEIETSILYEDLMNNKFYENQLLLKQNINHCNINRTNQKQGTCWLNALINVITFSPSLKSHIIQLFHKYKYKTTTFIT